MKDSEEFENSQENIFNIKSRIESLINKLIEINLILNEKGNYLKSSFLSNNSSENSTGGSSDNKIYLSQENNSINHLDRLNQIENKYQNVRPINIRSTLYMKKLKDFSPIKTIN